MLGENDLELRTAVERYRQHIDVLNGPATVENFSRSPYFRRNALAWFWNDALLRADQALLAKECLTFYEEDEE